MIERSPHLAVNGIVGARLRDHPIDGAEHMIWNLLRGAVVKCGFARLKRLKRFRRPVQRTLEIDSVQCGINKTRRPLIVRVVVPRAVDPRAVFEIQARHLRVVVRPIHQVHQTVHAPRLVAEDPVKIIKLPHPQQTIRPDFVAGEVIDRTDYDAEVPSLYLKDGSRIDCTRDDDSYYKRPPGFVYPTLDTIDFERPLDWAPESFQAFQASKATFDYSAPEEIPDHVFGTIDRVIAKAGAH